MKHGVTIAVGVDGGWADNGAVEWALREAKLTSAPIRVVHVIDDRPPLSAYFNLPGADAAARRLVGQVCDYLDRHDRAGIHRGVVRSGPPAHTLARATADDRMLVVGRRGHRVIDRLLIGSTSEGVALESGTAVVVPPKWRPGDPKAPVVVGVERVDRCDATVDFAVRFAAERGAPVRLVHSWDVSRVFTGDAAVDTVEIALRYYGRRLDAILDRCRGRHPDTTFETELRRGHPVSGLIEAADAADAQLLVVGGRAHGRVLSTLLGGTARGILQHATRPVAIVHHRARLD